MRRPPGSWTGLASLGNTVGMLGHVFDHQAPLTCPSEAELGALDFGYQNVLWEDSIGEVRNTETTRSPIAVQKGEERGREENPVGGKLS